MRPSTEVTIKAVGSAAFRFVLGVVLMLGGGFFLYQEMSAPPAHTVHVCLFAGIAVLGALVISPETITGAFKKGAEAASPYLPFGRRAYDNPPKDGSV